MIPFNKPYLTGEEITYIQASLEAGKISGNGPYTQKCEHFFEEKLPGSKCLLTTSCTDALEMCAILADIYPGDEVILPSYTFVSTALAFVRQGAKIVFADSRPDLPGLDETKIEALVTPRTKAIVVVHYAGVACDMDVVMAIAEKYGLVVIEDAAQAVDSFYKGRPLGSIGHMSAFSFHETKNIQCGEGGMLVVNDEHLKREQRSCGKKVQTGQNFSGEKLINTVGWIWVLLFFLQNMLLRVYGLSWNILSRYRAAAKPYGRGITGGFKVCRTCVCRNCLIIQPTMDIFFICFAVPRKNALN